MAEQNMQPLDATVDETIELANQAIEQTRTEIARSEALSQAEADLVQSIERLVDDHDGCARAMGPEQSIFSLNRAQVQS